MKKVIIAVMMVMMISGNALGQQITSGNYFGCRDEKVFDKIMDYVVAKDQIAFKRLLIAGLTTGECSMLQTGDKVQVMKTKIFSGMIKVRKYGELDEYWTVMEAVN